MFRFIKSIIFGDKKQKAKEKPILYNKQNDIDLDNPIEMGIYYEKSGQIDKAILQYELAVEQSFIGNHPYDRLAILYRKSKQIDDEIRVLETAIFVFKNIVSKHRGDRKPKLQKFEERLDKARKLKVKLES